MFFIILFNFGRSEEKLNQIEIATLGAGCFWCVEAVFERIDGVIDVVSGYTGGKTKNPSYKEVISGKTGHVETAQISFDKTKISYDQILEIFWLSHDPTTLNRQGNDVGTQYRSAIFFHNLNQKNIAERSLKEKSNSKIFKNRIVTTIEKLDIFYEAENYHQDYFNNNPNAPYCQYIILPKLKKLNLIQN
tara:strand:- start:14336 stop:14905 length:570 start_codon:yes stop_codon:yes gene_type:complete